MKTLVRQVGDYTVETDGERLYVNGREACVAAYLPLDHHLRCTVDTGQKGANGKRDLVGLTHQQYQIHKDAIARRDAERAARRAADPRCQRADLVTAWATLVARASEEREDAIRRLNSTGRGTIAPDRSTEIAAAKAAVDAFDAAHPEIVTALDAERKAKALEARAISMRYFD